MVVLWVFLILLHTITNSIDYGIKAYFGKFWNYGTMSISDNNDGDYAVLIDRSGAYLANMTITGGTGNDPLFGIYNSYSTVIENSSIKPFWKFIKYQSICCRI